MISFQRLELSRKAEYAPYLFSSRRGCGYSFANLYLWGRQRIAFIEGRMVIFSQFDRRAVYAFPVGSGDAAPALAAIVEDAHERGIPCCITGMKQEDCLLLERLYPNQFRFYNDRDGYDYVYAIDDLADLKGRKFQKKRNHLHRFWESHPDCKAEPITAENLEAVQDMAASWYLHRREIDPDGDYHLEELALTRALADPARLGLVGLAMVENGKILAFSLASALSEDTMDIHFEKGREDIDGTYPAINQAFAQYLRAQYPSVRWLNREDDMGIEGLRKAKLSYQPSFMIEKYWARLWEEEDEN